MPLIDDLGEVWDMDSASGTETGAHSGYVASPNGGTITTTTGKIAPTARDLEAGNSQYFSVPDNAALSLGSGVNRTYWAWVKGETLTGVPVIMSKGSFNPIDTSAEILVFYDTASTNRVKAIATVSTSLYEVAATAAGALSTGTWYLVVFIIDATNNLLGISVNGSTIETAAFPLDANDGGGAFIIGASPTQSLYWDGPIGQVGVLLRAATQADITELYNAGAGLSYDEINPPATGGAFFGGNVGPFHTSPFLY